MKSIKSVQEQSYGDWELIVVDDGSTDRTADMMKQLEEEDSRIRYHRIARIPNKGIATYLNIGIRASRGRYIARIDDDDKWCHRDKLKLQVDFLENNPEYVLVGGGGILVDEKGNQMFRYLKNETDEEIRNYALYSNPIAHTAVMFRKDVFEKIGGYNDINHAEDMDLALRFGKVGKLFNMKEYFIEYLAIGQNKSFLQQRQNTKQVLEIIKKYKDDYPHFTKAYMLNLTQYAYSFLPGFVRKGLQPFMYYFKRHHF
ncbi:MAG: glycosyltransferase family 2 protein [Ignavibacteria bacterium]|nr:glycosyltransferase family 2 protein [Ignavibacteria bacterium]